MIVQWQPNAFNHASFTHFLRSTKMKTTTIGFATILTTIQLATAAECTLDQSSLVLETSMAVPWANCTNKGYQTATSMLSLLPSDPAKFAAFCAIPTCVANLNSWLMSFPDCSVQGVSQKDTMSKLAGLVCDSGSTTGGACSVSQLMSVSQVLVAPVPATCASATGIPATTTIMGLLNQSTTIICNAPCIAAVKSTAAALPNCTTDGKSVNDATFYIKLCTSSASSFGLTMVSLAVALIGAMV
ncbi:hypothetical protein DYB28_012061 [Aphanomyces astaci]|uniref:Uncharacterized protein n=1 Tax=Aphanomyces astaci TaxID=112090 RepID=A0A9X8H6Z6_APHAT|nr:hypothetical protein DYB28_012061 [Aphanomyces astaci]